MRLQLILILIVTALLVSACGKKGPVRPVERPAAVEQPTVAPEEKSARKNSN